MTNKLNLPASYAVMNEEEMTYTQGGSALGAAATVVGAVVLASDAIAADMAKSPSNFLRDGVSTAMVVAFAPLSAILLIL